MIRIKSALLPLAVPVGLDDHPFEIQPVEMVVRCATGVIVVARSQAENQSPGRFIFRMCSTAAAGFHPVKATALLPQPGAGSSHASTAKGFFWIAL